MNATEKKKLEAAKKAAVKKVTAAKEKAKQRKQRKPGVIAAIIDIINETGPITKENILEKLAEKYPDRKKESMKKTINCQVPYFINQRQPFRVVKNDKSEWRIDGEVPSRDVNKEEKVVKKEKAGTKEKIVKFPPKPKTPKKELTLKPKKGKKKGKKNSK